MKFLTVIYLSLLVVASSYGNVVAESLSQTKLNDIKTIDIPKYEKTVEKNLGHSVKFDVNWETFKKVSAEGGQFLGSTLHSITGETVNNKTPEFKAAMKDIKVIKLNQDAKSTEAVVKNGSAGEIIIEGDFNAFNWNEGKGFATQLIALNKKK